MAHSKKIWEQGSKTLSEGEGTPETSFDKQNLRIIDQLEVAPDVIPYKVCAHWVPGQICYNIRGILLTN